MKAAVTYQGGKHRISTKIVDCFPPVPPGGRFFDLCCGGGSITLEVVDRGLVTPAQVVMVDHGPWGWFWSAIGAGTLDLDRLAWWFERVPQDKAEIKPWVQSLAAYVPPGGPDTIPVFLLLQAASFGGCPVWIQDNAWKKKGGWRDGAKGSAMNPNHLTIRDRVADLAHRMRGVTAAPVDCQAVLGALTKRDLVYIDPPYKGTAGYGHDLDLDLFLKTAETQAFGVLVSETKPWGPLAFKVRDPKPNLNGKGTTHTEEWLTFRGGWQ